MIADDKQLQLKSREDRIEDLRTKLNGANSNKEFQAFKEQIAADEQANLVMQDEVFEALEKIDDLSGKLASCNESLAICPGVERRGITSNLLAVIRDRLLSHQLAITLSRWSHFQRLFSYPTKTQPLLTQNHLYPAFYTLIIPENHRR